MTRPAHFRLKIVVKRDGSVDMVSVRDWPDEYIVISAIRAVRAWKFKAGRFEGRPADVSIDVDVFSY